MRSSAVAEKPRTVLTVALETPTPCFIFSLCNAMTIMGAGVSLYA